ncbi:MAG: S41 family peptidase [Candidatus Aerophobetes bacterium]|nr:S41 family peptidase [Candidatus Aerophobetes bacterium]
MKKRRVSLVVLVIITGLITGGIFFARSQAGGDLFLELNPLLKVYQAIRTQYIEEVKPSRLIEGAIKGMVNSLEDPHSRWIDPASYEEMKMQREGEFGGLGITIITKENFPTVVSVIKGTPAVKAGLKPRDKIVRINGESTEKITLQEAAEKMRGKPGTRVSITIERKGEENPLEFTITRAIIEIPNVEKQIVAKDIGYIKIIGFTNRDTDKDVRKALRELAKKKIEGLILDLRNNPGGLLEEAVKVSDEFLSSGEIVSIKGRDSSQDRIFLAHPEEEVEDMPLVVLINELSASASEIVAGAIKDQERGVLLGERSFGKGTVQEVITLEKEGALALTTAKYYTPSGVCIEGKGIEPDMKVEPFTPNLEEETILDEMRKSGDVKDFLRKYPLWEKENLTPLIDQLREEGIEAREDFLRRVLREKDKDEENDILNDKQLVQAIELLKCLSVLGRESNNR